MFLRFVGPDGGRRTGARRLDVLFIIQAATPGDATIANGVTQYEKAIGADVTVKQFAATQIVAPRFGRLLTWTLGAAGLNDFLQASFAALANKSNELEQRADQ